MCRHLKIQPLRSSRSRHSTKWIYHVRSPVRRVRCARGASDRWIEPTLALGWSREWIIPDTGAHSREQDLWRRFQMNPGDAVAIALNSDDEITAEPINACRHRILTPPNEHEQLEPLAWPFRGTQFRGSYSMSGDFSQMVCSLTRSVSRELCACRKRKESSHCHSALREQDQPHVPCVARVE